MDRAMPSLDREQGEQRLMGTATARANIALTKYWGKADLNANSPAVPSISVTLDPLVTHTRVEFDEALASDEVYINGQRATPEAAGRVQEALTRIRVRSRLTLPARVESTNNFETAAGLASSASGFAALVTAASRAAKLQLDRAELSRLARQSSASAARSIFGGFVELPAADPASGHVDVAAQPLYAEDYWNICIIVVVCARGPKHLGSTAAMLHTEKTSPFYQAFVRDAPELCARLREALAHRSLAAVGRVAELSALRMHASAMAADPAILYWTPTTLRVMEAARRLRESEGVLAFFTADAGPHVKVLCQEQDAVHVQKTLGEVEGVQETICTRPGPGVEP